MKDFEELWRDLSYNGGECIIHRGVEYRRVGRGKVIEVTHKLSGDNKWESYYIDDDYTFVWEALKDLAIRQIAKEETR